MATSIPPRSKADPAFTWNRESVFPTPAAWERELQKILKQIPSVQAFRGSLNESPARLAEALVAIEKLYVRAFKVYMYANFNSSVDTTDQAASAMSDKARGVYGRVMAATAFLRPELIAIGEKKLRRMMKADARLAVYDHFVHDLFRKQATVRSGEVEELLGMLIDPFSGSGSIYDMLVNADFKFTPAVDSSGRRREVTQSTLSKIMSEGDRVLRQTAWESYMDEHLEHKNTLAGALSTNIKQFVFNTQARRHSSSLAASLFEHNIPEEVFHNLITTFKKRLPVWHRYFEIRRRALGQKTIAPYDMWAPLSKKQVRIPYRQAVEWICRGLEPMGADYVETIRRGCLEERWVDVYPNQGKFNGAFSSGSPGTHPFIMMSYADNIFSLSTLAHELGHSMHSYLTWKNQPFVYADYSLFVAEVASNFHQAMVRAHLIEARKDRDFQIAVIEEAMANFFRYFFIMPTLARFELETHQRAEQGQPLTADALNTLMADLFAEAYGPGVKPDRQRIGMTWATFPHLYADFYVYQYATGISGANALSRRILRGEAGAVERYLGFLKTGSSLYPLDALRQAGVDLATPAAVEETFEVMSGYIERLEELVG